MAGSILSRDERAVFDLRKLYEGYGYKKYKMSRFEDYDLYVENRSFLTSKNVVSFSDFNGRLLALKPDVTLSIVKNARGTKGQPDKVYYNENVYRTAADTHELKEIMQVGLEYIGDVDMYAVCEVLLLAVKSLAAVGKKYVLDISHLGLIAGLLDSPEIDASLRESVLDSMSHRNVHGVRRLCEDAGVSPALTDKITALAGLYGPFRKVLPRLRAICGGTAALRELETLYSVLDGRDILRCINLDFSIVCDMSYYSGIIMQGFVDGLPAAILVGGQYDYLMEKFGKDCGAIGFAVHLDLLERYGREERDYDVDTVLLYDPNCDTRALTDAVDKLTAAGASVRVQRQKPRGIRCRRILRLTESGVQPVE